MGGSKPEYLESNRPSNANELQNRFLTVAVRKALLNRAREQAVVKTPGWK